MSTPRISVVLVSRNEEAHIEDCIDSVLRACGDVDSYEVLLVDSNSSDRTVERATEYPITVLQIPRDDLCTPGAGRFVGTKVARGDYLLFVDGDMTLETDWLPRALEFLDASPGVAGVTGHLNRVTDHDVQEVDALRGVALFRASSLAAVGGYDPHLQSSEDVDLCFRLADAGYSLVRLPFVVASHPDGIALREPVRRWRNGYFHGVGQAVRKAATSPSLLARHLYTLRHPLLIAVWLAVGIALVVFGPPAVAGWTMLSALGIVTLVARHGTRTAAVFLASFGLTLLGLLQGALSHPDSPDDYPVNDVAVKKAHADASDQP